MDAINGLLTYLQELPEAAIYLIQFTILLICGMGFPMPEDIPLFAVGYLAFKQRVNVHVAVLVGMVGVLAGDSLMFFLGHRFGRRLLQFKIFKRFLTEDRLHHLDKGFRKHGPKLLFAARFMPGLRSPTFFSAGLLRVPYWWLVVYDGGAALLSVPLIVYSAWLFGEHIEKVIHIAHNVQAGIVVIIVAVLLYAAVHYVMKSRLKKFEIEESANGTAPLPNDTPAISPNASATDADPTERTATGSNNDSPKS